MLFRDISHLFRIASFLLLAFLLASCSAPKRTLNQAELRDSFERYLAAYDDELAAISRKSVARLEYEYRASPNTQSYDVLVLSGGGAHGAFGAGFLKGWGKVDSEEFRRPDFDSVSGISTGSLIAPFAFIGTDEAYDSILDMYRNPEKDWVVANNVASFIVGSAYYDASKLHQRVRDSLTPELIDSLAMGSAQNKSLLVGATNLDYGMMRVWDLSTLAEQEDHSDVADEISKRLIASSAIPAIFPPVNIDNFLYVDGGASMQIVGGIEEREWLYQQEITGLNFINSGVKPLRIRIWLVINNKMLMEPEVTLPTWSSIATRSLASLMKASTLQSLQDIETYSQMINLRPEFDVQMYYVAIPQDYTIPDTVDIFDAAKMRGLADLGEKMGADPSSWRIRAIKPGAPK